MNWREAIAKTDAYLESKNVPDARVASGDADEIGVVEDDEASVGGLADVAFDGKRAESGAADEAFDGILLLDQGCAAVCDVFHKNLHFSE
jgi:hypothetical protein